KQRLVPLLRELENRGFHSVLVNYPLKRHDAALFHQLQSLNVNNAVCYRLPGTGKIQLTMTGIGGAHNLTGGAVSQWAGEVLSAPACRDVLYKLERSGAADRHAFLLVSFGGAPWPVESYLMGDLDQVPREVPQLPPPVNGVWIVSGFGRKGLRWDRGN